MNMCKNNFEEKIILFFEKTREMFQALNSTNETLSQNVETNKLNNNGLDSPSRLCLPSYSIYLKLAYYNFRHNGK